MSAGSILSLYIQCTRDDLFPVLLAWRQTASLHKGILHKQTSKKKVLTHYIPTQAKGMGHTAKDPSAEINICGYQE